MPFGFLRATKRNFRVADLRVRAGKVWIKRQCPFELGNTLLGPVGKDQDKAIREMESRVVRLREQQSVHPGFGRRQGGRVVATHQSGYSNGVDHSDSMNRKKIIWVERQRALKELAGPCQSLGRSGLVEPDLALKVE